MAQPLGTSARPRRQVEVINAARTGIGASSVAEIVVQELLPLEPDLVIFDGANDFGPGSMYALPAGLVPPGPVAGWTVEKYSAIARRLHSMRDRIQHGREPSKPAFPMQWPGSVDRLSPDITQAPLPMGLDTVITQFEHMRTALASIGSTLAMSSQVGIVSDGLALQLPRDQSIYNVLNVEHYPMPNRDIRALLDFQNRVFGLYAEKHHLPFFDKAASYPADPELFLDLFHMSPAGLRLQAWSYANAGTVA